MDDRNGEKNPYRELVVNNVEKIESPMTQMEQWSILSNILNYVQHSKFNSMNHSLSVKPVNRYKIKPDGGKEFREVDFGTIPQNLQEECKVIFSFCCISCNNCWNLSNDLKKNRKFFS